MASPPRTVEIADPGGISPPEERRANLNLKQEDVRRWLAVGLMAIFAVEILVSLYIMATGSKETWPDLKELLAMILGPTVALVGSATGFYFGTKADGRDKE